MTFSTVQSKVATVGIDFGCKSSRVAIIDTLVPNVIASEIGNLMPSYVTVIQPSSFVPCMWGLQNSDYIGRRVAVGEIAKRQMLRHPSDVIFNTKKLIGKKFDDYHVQEMRNKVPFGIVEGPRGEAWVEVHGMKFSPVEMTRAIFAKLKDIVQMNQFHHVFKVVISVPAFFSGQQREDIKSAGNRAGFEVLQLIDEPIAAALSSTTVKEGVVVVFGMGAGSYSISILHVSGTNIETKVQFDEPSVGGDQFDDILLDYFVTEVIRLHSVDIREDKHAIARLVEEAEKTKVRLSTEPEVRVSIPCLTGSANGPIDLNITVSRAKFENLVGHLVEQIQVKCQNIVKDAKLTDKDIREIIIMGGMTRVPKIQGIIHEVFGKQQSTRVNPEEAVVIGSALQAALTIEDQREMSTNMIPLSIGVESATGVFMRIIPRHTTIPATRTIKIPAWCRECLRIRIFMGEHIMVQHNKLLGEVEVCNNRRPYQGPDTFELTFEIDKDNVVKVAARNSDDQLEVASDVKKAVKVFPIEMVCKSNVKNAVENALLDWSMHIIGIHARLRNLARLIMNTLNDVLSVRKDELPKHLCEDAVKALIDLRMTLEEDVDVDVLKRKMHAAQSVESKMLRWKLPSDSTNVIAS
ncbi:heat shock 70 kDa protein, mitochondrial-like isoform X2 [Phragmites australis]|nr:heat shock 70 kDa protein, mitochondrial-like isoform X2 [Phragmites australis]